MIVLYTTNSSDCIKLEKELKQKNIKFFRVSDEDTIRAKGLGNSSFPVLEVEGIKMNYMTASEWVNNQ